MTNFPIPIEHVKRHKSLVVDHEGRSIILVLGADHQIHAYLDACPHTGASLDGAEGVKGRLTREGDALVCLWHGALFRKESGLCFAGPCAGKRLQSVEVRLEGGMIYPVT